jgi:hypothetical protein
VAPDGVAARRKRSAICRKVGLAEEQRVVEHPNGHMELMGDGEWRLREGSERLPLTYTLQVVRPG